MKRARCYEDGYIRIEAVFEVVEVDNSRIVPWRVELVRRRLRNGFSALVLLCGSAFGLICCIKMVKLRRRWHFGFP